MDASLVVHVDEETMKMARENADKSGIKLEKILENHIRFIANVGSQAQDLPPITKKLRGIIHVPDNYDWKEDIADVLTEKHVR